MNGNVKTTAETQMQVAIGLLLDTIGDKSVLVTDAVECSLRKIAKSHPNEILKSCCQYCERNTKNDSEHTLIVMNIMNNVCLEYIVAVDGDTILVLIDLCMELMVQNHYNELHPIQIAASNILVALGKKHSIQIMDALLKKFLPGVTPHYTIPHTMGALASANTFAVIPYLKNILDIMIPLLPNLRTDVLKQTFSYALECFSDSLIEYTANLDQAPDPTLAIADFQTELSVAYDILFSNWLTIKDPKVLTSVLHALSAMYNILSTERIRQNTVKTTQMLLALFKKHKDPLPIIKCLGAVISVSAKSDGTLLEPLLAPVLQMMSELICVSPDYAQPELLRTHSEVLRCFECFSQHYSDYIIDHVISQMKNNNDKERIKGLVVLTHLTNSAEGVVRSRLKDVLHVLTDMLTENNIRIKMALMKVIVAFAYKGFLSNKDTITEKFVLFIIKLCCKPSLSKEGDFSEISDLQITADNTLYMLTTSVKELEASLWDLLLKCLFLPEFYEATIIILRCLTHLASRKMQKGPCEGAFIRSLALLAQPLPNFKGTFALNFLKNIKICDEEAAQAVWEAKIPPLLKYLEQNYDNFNSKEWEDLLFDFLSLLSETITDEAFKEGLIMKIKEQLPLYSDKSFDIYQNGSKKYLERRLLLKSLAVISCYLSNKALVQQVVNIILENIKPQEYSELQACSEAIGICSRSNLKIVLDNLQAIKKDVLLKKSSKLFQFGFMKDQKSELEIEKVRYVIITSYAEICDEAPSELLLQTVQSEILSFVLVQLSTIKDFVIRKACLKTVGAVADAMHPNRNKLHIYLQERDSVLNVILSQMQLHSGPEYIELFPVIIPILTSLVRLPHVLESDQSAGITVAMFNPATLDEIVTLLEPWLSRKKVEQRLPALEALRMALQTYLDNVKFAYEGPTTFGQTGLILARIIPRCTDPNKNTRKVAIECVCLVLCIAGRYEGHMRDHDKILSNALLHIQEQIGSDDPKLLFNLTTDLAHSVALNVPKFQLVHFVEYLIDGLLDIEASSSTGCSVVLNNVIKLKGAELQGHVNELMTKILIILGKISCSRTRSNALCSILNLATHHLKPVVHILLQQTLPYDQSTCSVWATLGTDSAMMVEIFDQLKKLLKNTQLYEEPKGSEPLRIATLHTLQAICAFYELLKSPQSANICNQDFPELFTLFYIALASYIGTAAPVYTQTDKKATFIPNRDAYKINPFKTCLDTLKSFLQNIGSAQAASHLYVCTEGIGSFLEMVPKITENICAENSESLAWLIASLGPYIRSEVELQRIAVAAFFSALLKNKVNNQGVLAENILEMLLDAQNDSSPAVRRLCLQGLGYGCEFLNPEIVHRHSTLILNAFMQALDYSSVGESEVVYEAMLSFSKLLHAVNDKHLNQCQVTAAVRIKPLLQQENNSLRQASFRLLGDLASSIVADDAFQEQVNGNLITLLLHLSDEDPEVIKACKYSMRKVGQFLDCPPVNAMIQEHLIEEAVLHFAQFVIDFIKIMAENNQELFPQLIMTSLSYYKSPWLQIRANAALLTGVLYSQLKDEYKKQISFDTVTYRLLQLLKDDQQEVRARAVEAIAYLFAI
ncbi:maestro-related heat domain-containing [Holotrichia oblita]|uniref:Maestro-related heat domain-containing n=1 Tax=Holotrichia oblita TaxID=644536 RepID=A0ACB9TCS5_HOLOL|nr:maestro-related heat domain-containing [Holotrichia oblita]